MNIRSVAGLCLALIWGSPVRADEPPPARVAFYGEAWKRPHQANEAVRLSWHLEEGFLREGDAYRVTFSPDGGEVWKTVYRGTEPSCLWLTQGEETVANGVMRVEVVTADGRIRCEDIVRGLIVDSIVPDVVSEAPAVSGDREVLIRPKVKTQGPSGLALLQLWVTRDGGQRWQYAGSLRGAEEAYRFKGERGTYGFAFTGVSGSRVVEPHPNPGAPPEIEVQIAPEEPVVRLEIGRLKRFYRAGETLTFQWEIEDDDLAPGPAVAEYRAAGGPWVEILSGGPARGFHDWVLPGVTLTLSELRVRARDTRGNVGQRSVQLSCVVDADPPAGEVLGPALWDKEGPVRLQYRLTETGSGLEKASLLYRAAVGEPWLLFQDLPLAGLTAEKMLQDGGYELGFEIVDRAGNRRGADDGPTFRLLVDRTPPKVAIDAVSARPEGVSIRWTAHDPNLPEAPVSILFLREGERDWSVFREALPAAGQWEGPLPEGVQDGMGLSFRVLCKDAAGQTAHATAALRVMGTVPTIQLKQVRFVDVLKLLVEWEAAGNGLKENPVDLRIVYWQGDRQETLLAREGLPASGSLVVNIPDDLPANQLYVEAGCLNQWGGRQFHSATVDLRSPQQGPSLRFTRVVAGGGRIDVSWESTGVDLGETPVSVEYGEEGGAATVRKGLPPSGTLALEGILPGRRFLRIRGVCVDNKGRRGETAVFVIVPEDASPVSGARFRQVVRDGQKLSVTWEVEKGPVRIECRPAGGGDWTLVKEDLPPAGSFAWDVPEVFGSRVEIRLVADDAAGAPETVSFSEGGGRLPRPAVGTGSPRARAVWPSDLPRAAEKPAVLRGTPPDPLRGIREMLAAGRAEEAERSLQVYLAKHPDALDAYRLQIQAARQLARPAPEIVDLYRRALAVSPHNADLLNELGLTYLVAGDARQALAYFEEALAAGHTAEAYFNIGRARYRMREHKLAAAAFEKALALAPDHRDARYYLARIYTETGPVDRQKAIRAWEIVRDESRDDPERYERARAEIARLR